MKKLILTLFLNSIVLIAFSQSCEIFKEDFTGSSSFTDSIFPYGKPPTTCLYAAGGSSVNRATEQWMTLFGYTDFEIKRSNLNFPEDDYVILCKWRDSVNATTNEDCATTNLDDAFGASCSSPNRIWAINGTMVHQHPGAPNRKSKTFFAKYHGPINKIEIAMNGGCSVYSYDMWVDYISIVGSAKLPKIKILYTVLDSGKVQFMDSTLEADNNPPIWDFNDGQKSTEISPIITFDTTMNKIFYACLTRSNTCATDSICVEINFADTTTQLGYTTLSKSKNKFLDIVYRPENKSIHLKNNSNYDADFSITDINGKKIMNSYLMGKESKDINFNDLSKGFYFISYSNKLNFESSKIIVY